MTGLFELWVDHGYPVQPVLSEWTDGWSEVFAEHHCHLARPEWLTACQQAALRCAVHVPGMTVVS